MKFYMSFAELIIVALVALLVIHPKDIKGILLKVKKAKKVFNNYKKEILLSIEHENEELKVEAEELNVYLKKIIDIEGNYNGDYTLDAVKRKYNKIIKIDRPEFISLTRTQAEQDLNPLIKRSRYPKVTK